MLFWKMSACSSTQVYLRVLAVTISKKKKKSIYDEVDEESGFVCRYLYNNGHKEESIVFAEGQNFYQFGVNSFICSYTDVIY